MTENVKAELKGSAEKIGKRKGKGSKGNKLDLLKQQRETLNARIQVIEAREKTKEKKRETRRKILVGHYYIEQAKEKGTWHELCKVMRDYLKRDSDKVLFEGGE